MIVTSMAAVIRVQAGAARGRIGARVAGSAQAPGACPRTVVIEIAPGKRILRRATTHADSGLILRKPVPAGAPAPATPVDA